MDSLLYSAGNLPVGNQRYTDTNRDSLGEDRKMRRWWQTGPKDPDNLYVVKVWLQCGLCREPVAQTVLGKLRKNWKYQASSLSALILHHAEHQPDFVSIGTFMVQTRDWHIEWLKKHNIPFILQGAVSLEIGPYLVNYPQIPIGPFV